MGSKIAKGNWSHRKIAMEIHELLDLPLDKHGEPVLGYTIVRTIAKAMREALQRGESIRINGFGIFKPYLRPSHRTGNNIIKRGIANSPVAIEWGPKTFAKFTPSEQLMAMLNQGVNWDEKRAMESWNK